MNPRLVPCLISLVKYRTYKITYNKDGSENHEAVILRQMACDLVVK